MILRVDIERDLATPMVAEVRRGLQDTERLNRAAAEGMLPEVQNSLSSMAQSNHNSFGVRSSFWNQMLSATYAGQDTTSGFVSVPRPVALRYFGGTVYPKVSGNLAIPARSEAYGKSPRDFSDLRVAVLGKRPDGSLSLALVQNAQQSIKWGRKRKDGSRKIKQGEEKGGLVFYWLVPSATIEENPDVLPAPENLLAAAQQGVADYIGLLDRRSR